MPHKTRVFDSHGNRMCILRADKANNLVKHGEAIRLAEGGIQMTNYVSKCLSDKITTCVLCGYNGKNTRHHVVPKCIFRHFSASYEKHDFFFVDLCLHCHEAYETKANHLKYFMMSSTPQSQEIRTNISDIQRKQTRLSRLSAETLHEYADDLAGKSPEEAIAECKASCKQLNRQLWAEVIGHFGGPEEVTIQWANHFLDYAIQHSQHDISALKSQMETLFDQVKSNSSL